MQLKMSVGIKVTFTLCIINIWIPFSVFSALFCVYFLLPVCVYSLLLYWLCLCLCIIKFSFSLCFLCHCSAWMELTATLNGFLHVPHVHITPIQINSSVKESNMWDQLHNRMPFRTGHSTQHGLNKQFCQRAEGWSRVQVVDRER